ncbi:non-ribosomal peptide synthetase [Mycobacteroides salmoniphilum]|uniref:Chondramide synthase cmdD n=1 Tax=Mycobacteroides salmoniphilum TaxID=404941 RepID=A0A4R8SMZ3_9MYCO|nr:non-ribosomal peptide synthetase [Mycobacteroides salmoniphilum]TDZ99811.1 Chondramide synthase cmdD [Mycobacteroides salmoniphilum]
MDAQHLQRLELTRAQSEQWMAVDPADGAAGNVAHCVELTGPVDFPLLARACNYELAASGAGVIRFSERDGRPYQWLSPSLGRDLLWVDLSDEADPAAAAYSWMRGDYTGPLRMMCNPLTLWALIKVGPDHYFWYVRSHHAVVDGYGGLGITARIADYYSARIQGHEPAPYRGLSVSELIALEQEYTNSEVFELDRRYWAERTAELEVAVHNREAGARGISEHRAQDVISADLSARLDAVAGAAGTSIARVLTAALCGFESVLSGQETGMVALAVAGRRSTALKLSGGMISNAIPIGLPCGYPVTRDGLIGAAIAEVSTGLWHARYRFEDIRRDAGAVGQGRNAFGPTVNILLADNMMRLGAALGKYEILTSGNTEYLHVDVYRSGPEDLIRINLIGNGAFFTAADIRQRLDRCMRYLHEFLSASGDTPLGKINTLDDEERRQVLAWGDGNELAEPAVVPEKISLAEIFAERMANHGGEVAVRSDGISWTYREFARGVNRLARQLIELGVGPETVVGVAMVRSVDMLVSMYAVIVAGGAYLPIDPASPEHRNAYIAEVTTPRLVLTRSGDPHIQGLPGSVPVIAIDKIDLSGFSGSPVSDADRTCLLQPAHIAYIIFTSGSTGRPKGVMVDHAAIAAHLGWMQARYHMGSCDAVLHKTPATFDVSMWEMLWPILCGARLVIASPDRHTDHAYLETLIRTEQITIAHFVPSVLEVFADEADLSACRGLRMIISSGEVLPADLAVRVRAAGVEIHNLYGPTETAIDVTSHQVSEMDTDTVPIGVPVAGTRLFVLDGWLRPVPPEVAGELYIAGIQLARGYVSCPGLTAQRFVACPTEAGERMYRTGDVVRWNASGHLEYLGRKDFQMKVHGVRIEPGEIEAVLTDHPAVDRAVVIAHAEGSAKDPRLVGYVSASGDFGATHERDTVHRWRDVYDELYGNGTQHQSPRFGSGADDDFTGWNSSYTGAPIPLDQMREWRDLTVDRIRELSPRRVLEIGVGSGLILSKIAPLCEVYCGSDISPVTVARLEEWLHDVNEGWARRVHLIVGAADELSGYATGSFDTVILNSVVQYFPSACYLRRVIDEALRILAPGGALFLGDVRSLRYLEELETGVELARGNDGDVGDVRRRVRTRLSNQRELLVEPHFFSDIAHEFPGVIEHDIQLKRGSSVNELTRYRYDVVLHKLPKPTVSVRKATNVEYVDVDTIRALLLRRGMECVRVAGIPHRGLLTEVRAVEELAKNAKGVAGLPDRKDGLAYGRAEGMLPDDLHTVAADSGYSCAVTWSARRGCMEAVFVQKSALSGRCIVDAYVPGASGRSVTRSSNKPMAGVLADAVREFARARLPEYMAPSMIVVLDEWPLTASGKLDRAGLPAPSMVQKTYRAPTSEAERVLGGVFAEVLGVDRVGIDDDFFALGGDSILSTQIVARARKLSMVFTSRDVIEKRTVRRLVQFITSEATVPALQEVSGGGVGEMELSPAAGWLMELGGTGCSRFHLSTLVRLPKGIDRRSLVSVLAAVIERHDMLRARLCRIEVGSHQEWRMIAGAADSIDVDALLSRVHVESDQGIPKDVWEAAVSELNPFSGKVIRAVWLDFGSGCAGSLLLVAHHLIFDGVSSRIVMEDLAAAWVDVEAGRPAALAPGSTSMRTWLHALHAEANSASRVAELAMWKSMIEGPDPLPGVRALDPTVDTTSKIQRVQSFIDVDTTSAILGHVPVVSKTQIGEILIAALAVAVARWQGRRGVVLTSVLLRLIGHGREELAGADLSRTVGWFNSIYPLRVTLSDSGLEDISVDGADLAAVVSAVAQRVQRVPDGGVGYGLLRYVNRDTAQELPDEMPGRICFNYLGQIQTDTKDAGAWKPIVEGLYESMPDPALPAAAALDITVVVIDGRMIGDFGFPALLFEVREVQELAELWADVVSSLVVTVSSR